MTPAVQISEKVLKTSRDHSIDIMKGILIVGMVLAHTIGLLGQKKIYYTYIPSFISLSTFSGFNFCFGFACYMAYFKSSLSDAYRRIIVTASKPLVAFYISGICFRLLLDSNNFNLQSIAKILVLWDIPPYSEFLLSFALTLLLSAILSKLIKKIIENQWLLLIFIFVLALTTFIPYRNITLPQLALLIGSDRIPGFPVIQYLPLFLAGMYFAKYKVTLNRKLLSGAFLGLIGLLAFIYFTGHMPRQFPPSILWISASACIVYLYFLFSKILGSSKYCVNLFGSMGANALFYLLISNIMLFSFASRYPEANFGLIFCCIISITILAGINFCVSIVRPPTKRIN